MEAGQKDLIPQRLEERPKKLLFKVHIMDSPVTEQDAQPITAKVE